MGWGKRKMLPSGDLRKTLTYCSVGQFCSSKLKYAKMLNFSLIYEPQHEKTCFLHMQKQRLRSASQ